MVKKGFFDLLSSWKRKFGHKKKGSIWNAIPHFLPWSIWREQVNGVERYPVSLYFFEVVL